MRLHQYTPQRKSSCEKERHFAHGGEEYPSSGRIEENKARCEGQKGKPCRRVSGTHLYLFVAVLSDTHTPLMWVWQLATLSQTRHFVIPDESCRVYWNPLKQPVAAHTFLDGEKVLSDAGSVSTVWLQENPLSLIHI